jgi:hypothetical protein
VVSSPFSKTSFVNVINGLLGNKPKRTSVSPQLLTQFNHPLLSSTLGAPSACFLILSAVASSSSADLLFLSSPHILYFFILFFVSYMFLALLGRME